MAKYLVLWEIDSSRVPVNAKETATAWLAFVELVKAAIQRGFMKDWGIFPGELKGYAVVEGTEMAVMTGLTKSVPYVKHEVRAVASLAQVEEAMKASIMK